MSNDIFFQMANRGRLFFTKPASRVFLFIGYILFAIVVTLIGQILGGIVFVSLMAAGLIPGQSFDFADPQFDTASFGPIAQGLLLFSGFIFTAIIVILWVTLVEKRSLSSFGLGNPIKGFGLFLRGGLMALVAMALIAFGLTGAGMAEMSPVSVPPSWAAVIPLLVLILGWSVQGSTEELVTRGVLFQSIGIRYGLVAALLTSSLFFAVMHGMNPNTTPLFFINLILYSLFVCFYCLREASLWGACGYHAIWNFAQGDIFGFSVSGMQLGSDKLMTVTPTGPQLFTGGATGPEGGLATTIVLALSGIAVLLLVRPGKAETALAEANTAPVSDAA